MLHHYAVVIHRRVVLGARLVAVGELVLHHVGGQIAGSRHGLEGRAACPATSHPDSAPRRRPSPRCSSRGPAVPSECHAVETHVLGMVDYAQIGMSRRQLVQVLPGAVGGGVVPHDDLELVAGGLLQKRAHALAQHGQPVVGDKHDAHLGRDRGVVLPDAPREAGTDVTVPQRHRPVPEWTHRVLERHRYLHAQVGQALLLTSPSLLRRSRFCAFWAYSLATCSFLVTWGVSSYFLRQLSR